MEVADLNKKIEEMAHEMGFVAYGVATAEPLIDESLMFDDYLAKGYHADMEYLARNCDKRGNPSLLLEGAKSILCFMASYKSDLFVQKEGVPKMASYSAGSDYHKVIKDRLYIICKEIQNVFPSANFRVFTDSAPVMERAWALKAGLGFIGKSRMLINKKYGVHTLLGEIITDIEFPSNREIVKESCGNCRKCIDACPNGALSVEGGLDSRLCISYRTIESKLMRSEESLDLNYCGYFFGCDVCTDVCPWSHRDEQCKIEELLPVASRINISKEEWQAMTEENFNSLFSDSPLKRAGLLKIKDSINGL